MNGKGREEDLLRDSSSIGKREIKHELWFANRYVRL
jgi:hypothetical protein